MILVRMRSIRMKNGSCTNGRRVECSCVRGVGGRLVWDLQPVVGGGGGDDLSLAHSTILVRTR